MKRLLLAFVMLLAFAVPALAISAASTGAAYSAAPTEILGVKLNQPLSVPECDKVNGKYKDFWLKERCWTPDRDDHDKRLVWLTGEDIGAFKFLRDRAFLVIMLDGRVGAVAIGTKGIDVQQSAYDALVAKFGKPSKRRAVAKQNRFGATISAIDAEWKRPDGHVRLEGVTDTFDAGLITVMTHVMQRARDEAEAAKPKL